MESAKYLIENGKAVLGIEFGSTRIKAVLIDENHQPIATGAHEWENRLEDGYWTYHLEDIWTGLQDCYMNLQKDVEEKYAVKIKKLGAIGFSAMMHGYMAFDKDGKLLVPFRTWRNGTTGQAADALTALFNYNIPQRWSIAHLYQAILNKESHVSNIDFITTLAGYIHWQMTGKKVLGIGDASGMFPIDIQSKNYDSAMIKQFDELTADCNYAWKLEDILPEILLAGENAGVLSEAGAKLLDQTGTLEAGIPLCPPEGDAGTGMAATNSVAVRTGNVSAGTSVFAMIVLEDQLKNVYPEVDLVTTPDGSLTGMVHANNCTSDLNAWVNLFKEFSDAMGIKVDMNTLFGTLYRQALLGDKDCGGVLSYGFLSGENIMDVSEGRPMFVRTPESKFTLANFMRSHLYAALGALKVGMDILVNKENVIIDTMMGHGGLFKTEGVGQKIMAAAVGAPVAVVETAGEGGPWGEALLASYMLYKEENETLEHYLSEKVFKGEKGIIVKPDPEDVAGMNVYIDTFKKGIAIEKAAIDVM